MDVVDAVVEKLLKAGWQGAGSVDVPGDVVLSAAGPVAGRVSARLRFSKGKERCTIGPRITAFYEIGEGVGLNKCHSFRRFRTKNIEAIAKELTK